MKVAGPGAGAAIGRPGTLLRPADPRTRFPPETEPGRKSNHWAGQTVEELSEAMVASQAGLLSAAKQGGLLSASIRHKKE